MIYKIVRIDGKEDDVTSQTFSSYADAYDLLDKIFYYMFYFGPPGKYLYLSPPNDYMSAGGPK